MSRFRAKESPPLPKMEICTVRADLRLLFYVTLFSLATVFKKYISDH